MKSRFRSLRFSALGNEFCCRKLKQVAICLVLGLAEERSQGQVVAQFVGKKEVSFVLFQLAITIIPT